MRLFWQVSSPLLCVNCIAAGSDVTSCSTLPDLQWAREVQLPAQADTETVTPPSTPNTLFMNGSGAFPCPLVVLESQRQIDLGREHRWLLRHNAVQNHSLRGRVSSWAISVIMTAHVLGGLDKQWLWLLGVRHVGSMDNYDRCCTAAHTHTK